MTLEIDDLLGKKGFSESELRLDIAISLYQRKVASIARAAKVAGITKSDFETILLERGLLPKPDDDSQLNANERFLKYAPADHPLRPFIKPQPVHKNVTLEQIIAEQGYKGTDWDKLDAIAREMAIEEPLELLLAQLKE